MNQIYFGSLPREEIFKFNLVFLNEFKQFHNGNRL